MAETMENPQPDVNDAYFTRTDSPSAFIPQDFRQPSEDDDSEGARAAPKGWRCGDPLHHEIPKSGDPWESCLALTRQYDQDMCRGWNEEVDTLLVFAGLFSAVVTAFTIEAYQWLENNAEDLSVTLLAQISMQLATISPNSTNQVPITTTSSSTSQSVSETSATRINIYWFLSLTLSLTSALLSILCKQWLREYMRETSQTPKICIGIRQMRYEGLWKWQVPNIIASLPLLLQFALVLFFAGILELLWNIRPLVAAIITIVIGLVFAFVLLTTVTPFLQWLLFFIWPSSKNELPIQCAYKSPQSWAVLRFGTWMAQLLVLLPAVRLASSRQSSRGSIFEEFKTRLRGVYDEQWVGYDYDCVFHHDLMGKGNYVARGLTWIDKTFGDQHVALQIWHCLRDLKPSDASQVVLKSYKGMQEVISARISEVVPPLLDVAVSMDNSPDGNDISKEVTSMAYFMLYHSDGRSPYLPSCIEQCLRALNTVPEDPSIPASLFDCLLVHLENMKGPISDGTFPIASLLRALLTTGPAELATQLHLYTTGLLHPQRSFDHTYLPLLIGPVLKKLHPKTAVSLLNPLIPWLRHSLESESAFWAKRNRVKACMRATAEAFSDLNLEDVAMQEERKVLMEWVRACERWFAEVGIEDGVRQTIPHDWKHLSRKVKAHWRLNS